MSEEALNDVFRPARAKKRTQPARTGFRAYALRRLRRMALSWMILSALGIGANIAFQTYAQKKYGIGLEEQLAALDRISGGVLGLAALSEASTVQPDPSAPARNTTPLPPLTQPAPDALRAAPQATREIIGAGALVVRVPQKDP